MSGYISLRVVLRTTRIRVNKASTNRFIIYRRRFQIGRSQFVRVSLSTHLCRFVGREIDHRIHHAYIQALKGRRPRISTSWDHCLRDLIRSFNQGRMEDLSGCVFLNINGHRSNYLRRYAPLSSKTTNASLRSIVVQVSQGQQVVSLFIRRFLTSRVPVSGRYNLWTICSLSSSLRIHISPYPPTNPFHMTIYGIRTARGASFTICSRSLPIIPMICFTNRS